MRHNKKFNHLGRKSAHRKAMLSNMACSLLLHKRITTTVAKAKALKMFIEPLITRSKDDNTHNRRVTFSELKSKTAVSELFRTISLKIGDRPGGYTRILKLGTRMGDAAEMCIIELVDFNENMLAAKEDKKTSRRSRRSTKKKDEAPKSTAPVKEKVAAEPVKTIAENIEEAPAAETTTETTGEEIVE